MTQTSELEEIGFAFEHATQAGEQRLANMPRVISASYLATLDQLVLELSSGICVIAPTRRIEGLQDASEAQLSTIEISPSGFGLHFPAIDADVFIPALLSGTLGSERWMASTLGRKGGQSRSNAKSEAARENGKRGGRPKSS